MKTMATYHTGSERQEAFLPSYTFYRRYLCAIADSHNLYLYCQFPELPSDGATLFLAVCGWTSASLYVQPHAACEGEKEGLQGVAHSSASIHRHT